MKLKWKRVSPRGSRIVNCKERMNKMRVYVFFCPVMAQSNNCPKEERQQIAIFASGSLDWRGELRNDCFSELLRFCG